MEIHSIAGLDINRLTPLAIAKFGNSEFKSLEQIALMIRVAHCARVSYLNFEGKDDYEADIKLYNTLLTSKHLSPFEHVAQALSSSIWSGNFKGFLQHRKTIPEENLRDPRVILK